MNIRKRRATRIKNCSKFLRKQTSKNKSDRFRVQRVMKKKGDELYVKRKGYDDLFNSWVNKKYIIILNKFLPRTRQSYQKHFSNYALKS